MTVPFSWGTRPGWAKTNWSVPIVWLGCVIFFPQRTPSVFSADNLWHNRLLFNCTNRHETHDGRSFRNLLNRFGKIPSCAMRSMTMTRRWRSWWCRLKNSYCREERWVGKVIFLMSISDKCLAADLYVRSDVGIYAMSGFLGDLRCSLVVSTHLPSCISTEICRTLPESRWNNFTFISEVKPSFE